MKKSQSQSQSQGVTLCHSRTLCRHNDDRLCLRLSLCGSSLVLFRGVDSQEQRATVLRIGLTSKLLISRISTSWAALPGSQYFAARPPRATAFDVRGWCVWVKGKFRCVSFRKCLSNSDMPNQFHTLESMKTSSLSFSTTSGTVSPPAAPFHRFDGNHLQSQGKYHLQSQGKCPDWPL